MLRQLLLFSVLVCAGVVSAQTKVPIYVRMNECEKNCVERIRKAAPEGADVMRESMNTCRQERKVAEETDQMTGGKDAQLKFIAKYNAVDPAEAEKAPASEN